MTILTKILQSVAIQYSFDQQFQLIPIIVNWFTLYVLYICTISAYSQICNEPGAIMSTHPCPGQQLHTGHVVTWSPLVLAPHTNTSVYQSVSSFNKTYSVFSINHHQFNWTTWISKLHTWIFGYLSRYFIFDDNISIPSKYFWSLSHLRQVNIIEMHWRKMRWINT